MPRLSFPLNKYIKAVEKIAKEKGYSKVTYKEGSKGSAFHFELFMDNESIPCDVWQVHTEHGARREVTSKEDYKKAARKLSVDMDYFEEILRSL